MNNTEYDDNIQASQPDSTSPSEADFDLLRIDEMSFQEAKDYVMQFLITKKKTEAALHEKQQDLNKWNERLAFAEKKGLTDQIEEVKRQLHFLTREKATLTAELDELKRKILVLKEKLEYKAKNEGVPSSAFAEQLLADLGQLADVEEYKLEEAMKQQAAEDELAKLKAKLGMQ